MTALRRPASALVLAVLAFGLVTGCAGSAERRADASAVATTAPGGEVAGRELAGRYAHYDVVAYQSDDMKTLIVSYGFTDLTVEDGRLMAQESFCHADHRSDQPIRTSISDAATSAIRPVAVAVTVTSRNGRTRLLRPETPTGIGIHLADPAHDPLPTDPNDPRIADDDHDGKPGVTVHIDVDGALQGDLYIARRERFAYDVTRQPDGSLTGTVEDHSEQLLIGATDDVFLTQAPWVQVPDRAKSPIILRPVARSWDCARLMDRRAELFPPTPSVDW